MSGCDELRPLLGGYVLEALEPAEAEAVREHLRTCAACAAEHESLADLPALLDFAAPLDPPEEPLPAGHEEALLDRVARESERRTSPRPPSRWMRRRSWAWWRPRVAAAAALLVAAAAGAGAAVALRGDGAPRPSRSYVFELRPAAGGPDARARIAVYRVRGGTGVHLWASGLPAGPGRVYEMLCESRGWSASAGTFRADASGRVDAKLTTAARVGEYDRVRVVYRDASGKTRDVLTGRLF